MFIYISCLILWIYFLSIFKRNKLGFYYFVIGSVGLFIFLLTGLMETLIDPISNLITFLVGLFPPISSEIQAYPEYKLIFLNIDIPISLYIDFECSGILEIFAFISLVSFFSAYNMIEKIVINLIGVIYIIAANVIRILSIIYIVDIFGSEYYYIAHTLIGRIIFYILTILLYFVIFTKHQIINQKVGNFEYN